MLTLQSTLYRPTQAVDMLNIYFSCDRIVACGQQIVAFGEEQKKWQFKISIESRKTIFKNAFRTKSLKSSEIHLSIDFCKVWKCLRVILLNSNVFQMPIDMCDTVTSWYSCIHLKPTIQLPIYCNKPLAYMLNCFKTLSSLGLMKEKFQKHEIWSECLSYSTTTFPYPADLKKKYFWKSYCIHST